jgi:hypothetical protein
MNELNFWRIKNEKCIRYFVLWSSYESFVLYPRRLKAFRETRNDIVNGIIEDLKKSDQILVIKEKDGTKK